MTMYLRILIASGSRLEERACEMVAASAGIENSLIRKRACTTAAAPLPAAVKNSQIWKSISATIISPASASVQTSFAAPTATADGL